MSTIKDVAKLAKVSISTVSYALNDSGVVSEETKKKILEAAETLNYKPSGIARSLKKQKTEIIGLFIDNISGPIYSEILRGIQEVAASSQYEVIVGDCYANSNTLKKLLSERIVDGAIVLASSVYDDTLVEIASENLPIVVLDREIDNKYIYSVLIDNENGAYDVVRHFRAMGYKDIGIINGSMNSYDGKKRFEGFKKGIKDFNMNFDEKWYGQGDFTEDSGFREMERIIKAKSLPRAFFIVNDEMAIGAIDALNQSSIRIPEDVAIIGFDDIQLASYITPKLTTVHRPSYELGILSAHTLFNCLNKKNTTKRMILSTELIIRESCKAAEE